MVPNCDGAIVQNATERSLERCNTMPYKAISYQIHQSNIIATPCKSNQVEPSLCKTRQHKAWFLTGKERRVGSRVGWVKKTKEMCARPRKRFSAGEMGEEGFEVRNEKTVGRLEPKPCFTWETLEQAAFPQDISSSSLSGKVWHVLFYHDFTFYKQNNELIKRSQNRVLHVKLWNMLLLSALERYLIAIFVITTLLFGFHFQLKSIELDRIGYQSCILRKSETSCGFHTQLFSSQVWFSPELLLYINPTIMMATFLE